MPEESLREILGRFQAGDAEAGRELALKLKPLVEALAGRIAAAPEVEDYCQVGMIGLLKAARRFRAELQVKFTTFAVAWIKGEMRAYRRKYRSPVKVSRSLWEQSRALARAQEHLVQTLQREPTVTELAREVGITAEEVALALEASLPLASLEEDPPAAREGTSQEEELLDRLALREGMMRLAPMEREIVILRFFRELTQAEIARRLALSQRQVSRLEKRILWQLRQYLEH